MIDATGKGFRELVGTSLDVEEAGFAVEVASVEEPSAGHTSVLFKGPSKPVLDQAIYTLRHDQDVLPVFIVPISSDAGGTVYEAEFNPIPEEVPAAEHDGPDGS